MIGLGFRRRLTPTNAETDRQPRAVKYRRVVHNDVIMIACRTGHVIADVSGQRRSSSTGHGHFAQETGLSIIDISSARHQTDGRYVYCNWTVAFTYLQLLNSLAMLMTHFCSYTSFQSCSEAVLQERSISAFSLRSRTHNKILIDNTGPH